VGKEVRHVWVNNSDAGSEVRKEKSSVMVIITIAQQSRRIWE